MTVEYRTSSRPALLVGLLALAVAVALSPPVSFRWFALGEPPSFAMPALWTTSALLVLAAGILVARRATVGAVIPAVLLGLIVVVCSELAARVMAGALLPADTLAAMARVADGTYPERASVTGHPFLQYIGQGNVNNLGFGVERDFAIDKPADVTRIAVLGGSTSAHGNWPAMMEPMLGRAAERADDGRRFEVLNFAFNGYSSAHVTVNFFLNVADHDPDYVVLHTGWNDTVFRGRETPVRSDYSDVFKPFAYPDIPDRWPLRLSVVYRYLHHLRVGFPAWAEVAPAIHGERNAPASYDDPGELVVLERNLEKIIDFARVRGIRIVLATQPYSQDPTIPNRVEADHLDQCSDLLRDLHRAHPDTTLLVDLDATMTGRYDELFEDLGHLHEPGQQMKARAIGAAILTDAGVATDADTDAEIDVLPAAGPAARP